MIICKPEWITHTESARSVTMKKQAIFSIHAHPDGKRIATGGMDATIRIWNTEPILDEKVELDPQCHKLLSTLALHDGAVLCVRWSNNGKYLASGSDKDNLIIIWELDSRPTTSVPFGNQYVNHESWRAVQYLRGHSADVQDLAWSKDDKYLASCGVDGLLIVWDGVTWGQVRIIDQHRGIVKGVDWDPAGKYLASQADDKSVKIWRTSDWELEKEIVKPFVNSIELALFRRLSWSPVGTDFVIVSAVNGNACVAAIIDRNDWEPKISLFGHSTPVVVTKYNPHMFYSSSEKSTDASGRGSPALVSLCATGSLDGSVTIWSTEKDVPICAVDDFFRKGVYDLTWSPDGTTLYACSDDGTVGCVRLGGYLPTIAPESETTNTLAKLAGTHSNTHLAESITQLDMETDYTIANRISSSQRIADIMSNGVETPQSAAMSSINTKPEPFKQIEVIKDGKRRIQPFKIANGPVLPAQVNTFQPTEQVSHKRLRMEDSIYKQGQSASSLENRVEYTTSSIYVPQGGLSASINHTKTTAQSNTTAMSNGSTSESTVLRERPAWVDSASVPSSVLESKIRLPVPVLKSKCIYKHDTNHQSIVMESHNNTHHGDHKELAKIVVSCQGSVLWTDYLASPVLLMTGNQNYSVAACENATLHVYSLSGRRLIPPIVLESTPVILHSYEQWLLCLTMTGLLYVWDIVNKKKHIHSISIAPILGIAHSSSNSSSQSTPSIKDARIRKNGLPIFTTSNQQAFTYDLTMGVWICISDAWYSVSDLWHAGSRTTQLHPDQHPLGWLFTAVTSMNTPSYSLGSEPLSSDVNDSITLSHLEIQLAVSVLLDSPEEYKNCLLLYAKRLARTGAQKKVEDLLGWLAGPPFIPVNETWTPNVLDNLLKKDLLKHILPILSSNRQLQRITNEYRQLV